MKKTALCMLLLCAIAFAAASHVMPVRSNGTVPVWLVAAPFPSELPLMAGKPCTGFATDYLTALGGESQAIPKEGDVVATADGQKITWQPIFSDSTGIISFIDVVPKNQAETGVAYAFCTINAPEPQRLIFKVGSNDAVRIWVNQTLVHDHHIHRTLRAGEDTVPVQLNKGDNRVLVKIDQVGGSWGFIVAMEDEKGRPQSALKSSILLAQPFRTGIYAAKLQPTPLLYRTDSGQKQKAIIEVISIGLKNVVCRLSSPEWKEPLQVKLGDIAAGRMYRDLYVPVMPKGGTIEAVLQAGKEMYTVPPINMTALRPWTVYLVQHVHTDIGYTRPQTEILPEHLRYIDTALDYCDLTDSYPDDAKFRWTCEISWAVREYLKLRPAWQIERLKKRIAEGRIEVAGMFLNMSDIADEATLAASLQPLSECGARLGAPVVTAMQNDVNGMAWCMTDYFADAGIKYVSMGINQTRSLLPFDKPTPFWWESPSGKRVLAYRPDHYHTGNFFAIHHGKMDLFQGPFLNYLHNLETVGYPFDRVAVQYSGYHTDNSPPALKECDLVRAWNEKYESPKLRIAVAREYLDYISEHHSQDLQTFRAAWPDWWTDGFGSAARETAVTRLMQLRMQTNQGLLAMARLNDIPLAQGLNDRIEKVNDNLLFYDEHTFGAAESIDDPLAENTRVQWNEKSSYAWEAVKGATMMTEEAMGQIQGLIPRTQVPTLAVFNTLNWPRDGVIQVFIDHEILPADKDFRIVDAVSGEPVPAQVISSRAEGSYWAIGVKGVPPLGFKSYRIVSVDSRPLQAKPAADHQVLENSFYRLQVDPQTGAVMSLVDKTMQKELVDNQAKWQAGQYIYETLVGDRSSFKGHFTRTSLSDVKVVRLADGPLWKSLLISGVGLGLEPGKTMNCEIRLFETEKRIEWMFSARKMPVLEPEAIYVAFPFQLSNAAIRYEVQGGLVEPGKGQIPHSASDWQSIQNYAIVQGDEGQVVWGSSEAPLVQLGDINLGKYQPVTQIEKPHIYSWVMNNYWFTNFTASQEGEFRWRYYLTSGPNKDPGAAARFGWGSAVPLAVRVLAAGTSGKNNPVWQGLNLDQANLLLVSAQPAKSAQGIVLHLRETAGRPAAIAVDNLLPGKRRVRATLVNVLQEPLADGITAIDIKPFEVKFVKLVWD